MAKIKCAECEYGRRANMPRHGNSGSAYRGSFSQEAYICKHPHPVLGQPIIFYGTTAPRKCPKRQDKEVDHGK